MFAGAIAVAAGVPGVLVAVGVPAGVIAAGVRVGAIASRLDADRGKAPARLNASISFFLESLHGRPGAGAGHRRLNQQTISTSRDRTDTDITITATIGSAVAH